MEDFDALEEDFNTPPSDTQMDGQLTHLELPLYSIGGITSPQTMKLRGKLNGEIIVIMIDSGASHNFLSRKLVQRMGIPVLQSHNFQVRLGDGSKSPTLGKCKGVSVTADTCEILSDFYVFPLGGVDAIFGVAWLQTLGEVQVNWSKLRISFSLHGQSHTLHGDVSLHRTPVSLRSLFRIINIDYCALLFESERE